MKPIRTLVILLILVLLLSSVPTTRLRPTRAAEPQVDAAPATHIIEPLNMLKDTGATGPPPFSVFGALPVEDPEPSRRASSAIRSPADNWTIYCVDCPKNFSGMGDRSLHLDADGRPHIAYGGDHLYYAWYDGATWRVETVDSASGVGQYTSLALGSAGSPYISYYDDTNGDLKYAHWTGSGWDIQTVDSVGNVGMYTSLALDVSGNPHVSYYDSINDVVKYACWTGTAWDIQTVDSTWGESTSLALDAAGYPHISYGRKYARWTGSTWDIQIVDSGVGVGWHTSLALDASGHPHIAYLGEYSNDLKYARWTGGTWNTQTVDSGNITWPSLTLDGSGNPLISYLDRDLKYARWTGSAWDIQTVDDAGNTGCYTSLALDIPGSPHISYYNYYNGDLRYARWTGSAWDIQTVDNAGDVGLYTSLALDAPGNPHISYYDDTNSDLKYARWTGSAWDIQAVDNPGNVGAYTSLALDGASHPHISYISYYGGGSNLKYARWTSSVWDIQTVDSSGGALYTSLALDASGNPHISYLGYTTTLNLMYARWTGSTWDIQMVDGDGVMPFYGISLALDTSGHAHISYSDYNSGNLMYARWTGNAWDIQIVDWGLFSSLALDASDNPHISYLGHGGDLKYARWTGSAWDIQTVGSSGGVGEGDVGVDLSLALDTSDHPHISYLGGYPNNDLKYAYWTGSAWYTQTVDSIGVGGGYTSLALDPSGHPHISYYKVKQYDYYTNGDLKCAVVGNLPPPPPLLDKQATPIDGLRNNDTLTYTLTLSGLGLRVRLWDPLPAAVHYVSGSITSTITPPAVYSPAVKAIVWQGTLPTDTAQAVRFQVTPGITGTGSLSLSLPIVNTAWLTDTHGRSVSATVIVNSWRVYLPLVVRQSL